MAKAEFKHAYPSYGTFTHRRLYCMWRARVPRIHIRLVMQAVSGTKLFRSCSGPIFQKQHNCKTQPARQRIAGRIRGPFRKNTEKHHNCKNQPARHRIAGRVRGPFRTNTEFDVFSCFNLVWCFPLVSVCCGAFSCFRFLCQPHRLPTSQPYSLPASHL